MSKPKRPAKKTLAKKEPRPIGQKPKAFSEENISQLETLISAGNSVKISCEALGLNERSYYTWIEESEKEDAKQVYVEFASRMKKAIGLSKVSLVKNIVDQGKGDWRASAWLLERRFPDEFGQKETVDVKHRGKIAHDHQHKTIHLHLPVEIATPRNITPPSAPQIKATSTPKAS